MVVCRIYGWLVLCKDAPNKSMDVRAKQRLCYRSFLVNPNLLGGGFAPRHLNRYALSGESEDFSHSAQIRLTVRHVNPSIVWYSAGRSRPHLQTFPSNCRGCKLFRCPFPFGLPRWYFIIFSCVLITPRLTNHRSGRRTNDFVKIYVACAAAQFGR